MIKLFEISPFTGDFYSFSIFIDDLNANEVQLGSLGSYFCAVGLS
jgi:hypothetical protein